MEDKKCIGSIFKTMSPSCLFYFWLTCLLITLAIIFLQLFLCVCTNSVFCYSNSTYVAIFSSVLFYGFAIDAKKNEWLSKRRRVDTSELRSLIAEFESCSKLLNNSISDAKIQVARQECKAIDEGLKKKETFFELDVLGLRKALVDIYPYCELEAKCYAELRTLREYSAELDDYPESEKRIRDLLSRASRPNDNPKNQYDCEIRAELKEMKNQIAFLDQTWAEGEIIIERHLWTSIGIMAGAFLIGVLPLVHPMSSDRSLGLINWIFLGATGGTFSALLPRHREGYTEIGETAGKKIWKSTFSSLVIGGITATLLYSGLKSGLVSGAAFPKITETIGSEKIDWKYTGSAIFWGLFSGISIKIYSSLAGVAEGKIGSEG